jgi:hypothetical protein
MAANDSFSNSFVIFVPFVVKSDAWTGVRTAIAYGRGQTTV